MADLSEGPVGRTRQRVREALQTELGRIDDLVIDVLNSVPAGERDVESAGTQLLMGE
jgi:hypothetical protein